MQSGHIYLDAGNTRLKWRLWNTQDVRHEGAARYAELDHFWSLCLPGMHAYLACVASAESARQLEANLLQHGVVVTRLHSQHQGGGVTNHYADPAQLGVDRWLALVGARQRTQSDCLVVSAGTALTVDALTVAGDFLGGVILPGYALMQQALHEGTAKINAGEGQWQDFPTSTADAVRTGAITALVGAVQVRYAALARVSTATPLCLLTGGDAELLASHLSAVPVVQRSVVPHLVLEGIEHWVGEYGC